MMPAAAGFRPARRAAGSKRPARLYRQALKRHWAAFCQSGGRLDWTRHWELRLNPLPLFAPFAPLAVAGS